MEQIFKKYGFPVGAIYNIESDIVLTVKSAEEIKQEKGSIFVWAENTDEDAKKTYLVATKKN